MAARIMQLRAAQVGIQYTAKVLLSKGRGGNSLCCTTAIYCDSHGEHFGPENSRTYANSSGFACQCK